MPRGGARPGAGRPKKPESEKAQRNKPAAKKAAGAGFSPAGVKGADAPANWPFGAQPPAPPPEGKPDEPADDQPVISAATPLEFLLEVMKSDAVKLPVRMQAAAIAAPFLHAKPAPKGKKDEAAERAAAAGASKFGRKAPPLALVKAAAK